MPHGVVSASLKQLSVGDSVVLQCSIVLAALVTERNLLRHTGHCKKLAPTWSQLADEYKTNDKVSIDQIDCTRAKTVCEKSEVRGYPTLKAYLNGEQHAVFKGT